MPPLTTPNNNPIQLLPMQLSGLNLRQALRFLGTALYASHNLLYFVLTKLLANRIHFSRKLLKLQCCCLHPL
jgi:hypothetical protein